jgi:hypothetical protein
MVWQLKINSSHWLLQEEDHLQLALSKPTPVKM